MSLGDSYASGEGAEAYDAETNSVGHNRCHRSANAWPRLLGVVKDHHLACSGAKLEHLYNGQSEAPDDTGQIPWLETILGTTAVDVVTITMGGNDLDFAGKVFACWATDKYSPVSCLSNHDKLRRDVRAMKPKLVTAYESVLSAVPTTTRVVVVGYPDIVPGPDHDDNCPWLTRQEKVSIQILEQEMDALFGASAGAAGIEYSSIRGALAGHELCTGDTWMRKILAGHAVLDRKEMAHPTKDGQNAMAMKVRTFLKNSIPSNCVSRTNLAVIVDDSISMADNDPDGIRTHALEYLITKPSGQARTMGAIEFGGSAATLFSPALVSASRTTMLASLGELQNDGVPDDDGGGTDYNAAFGASRADQPAATARIFLTDGGHNDGEYEDRHLGGPPTYVIGLNIGPSGQGNEEADRLEQIASDTGGRYFPLADYVDEDTTTQLSRLQPAFAKIDALLDCRRLIKDSTQNLARQGDFTKPVNASFRGGNALEIVASWATPGTDIDLPRIVARNRRGKKLADAKGKGKRKKLEINLVEGSTFDTVTVQRPKRAKSLSVRAKAEVLPAPADVSIQIRAVPPGVVPPAGTVIVPPPPPPPPAPRKVLTVDNRVTNGATEMREDSTPARLTTKPWVYCGSRGCNIAGTERVSGQTYDAAVCQSQGEQTTNGDDTSSVDDHNPGLYTSTLYYGVRLSDGTFGYVSEVWIRSADRGGLGLPAC